MRQQVAKPGGPCWRSGCKGGEALSASSIPLDVGLRAPLPLSIPRRKVPQYSWASPAAAAPQRPFAGRGEHPRAPTGTHSHAGSAPPQPPHALTERRHGAGLQQQAVLAAARLQQGARPRLLLPEQPQPFAQSHGSRRPRGGGRRGPGAGGGEGASVSSGARRGARGPPAAPRELLPAPVPGPGRFSQGGGQGGRPCPAPARRSPQQASGSLRCPAQREGSGASPAGGPADASSSSGSPGCGRRGGSDLPLCSPPFSSHPR